MSKLKPELKGAQEIFIKELDTHLLFFDALLKKLPISGENEEFEKFYQENAKALEHRFHTIKGGAGFLQLSQIRELAMKAEKIFKQQVTPPEECFNDLRSLIRALSAEAVILKKEW